MYPGDGMNARTRLTRTIYLFGSTTNGPYGLMTFSPRGWVTTRRNPAEMRWRMDEEGRLTFLSYALRQTSVLSPGPDGGYNPLKGHSHYLHPVFSLDQPPYGGVSRPVFVNTLPKSGTYLVARALEYIGFTNTGLHVADDFLHDNRGIPEAEIHWEPQTREVAVPARAVARIMRRGEFAVGHLEMPDQMSQVSRAGVRLVNIIREPRAMLLSMFHFKNMKVKPTPEARLWQSMDGLDAFKAFLAASPVRGWMGQLEAIAENFSYLRFEDVIAGKVSARAAGLYLSRRLPAAIQAVRGTSTSTLVERDRSEKADFTQDPAVRTYLEEIGAMDLSRRYWPELHRD